MSASPLTTRLRVLALIAGCVAVLGLAACGGDDETTASSTTTPTGATGAETTDTTDTTDLSGGDASELRDQFNQQLLQVLTTTQDLTESQAQCAIDALEESVSDEELQEAIVEAAESGQPPRT